MCKSPVESPTREIYQFPARNASIVAGVAVLTFTLSVTSGPGCGLKFFACLPVGAEH